MAGYRHYVTYFRDQAFGQPSTYLTACGCVGEFPPGGFTWHDQPWCALCKEINDLDTQQNTTEAGSLPSYTTTDRFVAFLYELLRDEVPAGTVERVLQNSSNQATYRLTNGHLAAYAQYVADKLRA